MIELSIIIPHYNSTESLWYLLNTIPNIKNVEIIIVDDRSSVDYKKKLNKLKKNTYHKNIYFYNNMTNKKNAGTCRNIGMQHAKGKWFLFADSDDFYFKDIYDYVSKYFNTSNDVVFFTPSSIEYPSGDMSDRHVSYKNLINNYINEKSLKTEVKLRYSFYVPWSKLIRANFLKDNDIKFDEIIASNDMNFSTKVGYYMTKFEVTNKMIYCVTRNKGSLTMNVSGEIFESRLKAYIDYSNFLRVKLNVKEISFFEFKGTGFILNIIRYRLGLKKILSTYLLLRKSKIKVVDLNFLNPIYTIKKIIYHYSHHKKNKKYHSM